MTATYGAVHQRLRRLFGPAVDYACWECGEPATQWAYDHMDPQEVKGSEGHGVIVVYSTDLARYRPLCRSCHAQEDETYSLRTHCSKNHPYSPENTYVAPTGKRFCRECNRQAVAAYRRAKVAAL